MSALKKFLKRNSRNTLLKGLSRFGLSINRLYENRNYDIHSNGELTVLKKLNSLGPKVVFDVGANIGNYSSIACKLLPDASIYAFEPLQEPFLQLEQVADSLQNLKAYQCGLSDETAKKAFYVGVESEHSSLIKIKGMQREVTGKIPIDVMTGHDFMQSNGLGSIDLLKIDVEGAEMSVLQGFSQAFENRLIRACQFEYGYANITSHTLLLDFYGFFEKYGYKLGKIFPKNVEFRDYHVKQEDFLGPNYLAVEGSELELIELLSKS